MSWAESVISLHFNYYDVKLFKKLAQGVPYMVIILITEINLITHIYQQNLAQVKSKQRGSERVNEWIFSCPQVLEPELSVFSLFLLMLTDK